MELKEIAVTALIALGLFVFFRTMVEAMIWVCTYVFVAVQA